MTTKNEQISPVSDNAKRVEEIKKYYIGSDIEFRNNTEVQQAVKIRFLLSELDRRDADNYELEKLVKSAYEEGCVDGHKNPFTRIQILWDKSISKKKLGE